MKLCDGDGVEVKRGEAGILYSRGLGGFRGYWENEDATVKAFLDGEWATVGDVARQDEEGFYYIVDRLNDMIITGGVNVYPAEIEGVLHRMEKIQDAAVIGVPDQNWGEAVKAIVVPLKNGDLTEKEVIRFCEDHLAKCKVPKSVDFVEAIPRTATGKILKKDIRKKYWPDEVVQVS